MKNYVKIYVKNPGFFKKIPVFAKNPEFLQKIPVFAKNPEIFKSREKTRENLRKNTTILHYKRVIDSVF